MKTRKKSKATPRRARSDELNKLIRAAALTVDPQGRISSLATKAGVSGESIRNSIRIARFSVGLACAIESAVGASVLSKEQLCDKFAK